MACRDHQYVLTVASVCSRVTQTTRMKVDGSVTLLQRNLELAISYNTGTIYIILYILMLASMDKVRGALIIDKFFFKQYVSRLTEIDT